MYKVGDKVIPISKTVEGFEKLERSISWERAKKLNQKFLYIICIYDEKKLEKLKQQHHFKETTKAPILVLSEHMENGGDYFYPKDVSFLNDLTIEEYVKSIKQVL